VIITDAGTCGRSYRYGLVVSRGRISYEGDSSVIISGGVDPRGPRIREPALRPVGRAGRRPALQIRWRRPLAGRVVRLALLGPLAGGTTRLGPATSEGLIGTDIGIDGSGPKPAVPTRRGKRTWKPKHRL